MEDGRMEMEARLPGNLAVAELGDEESYRGEKSWNKSSIWFLKVALYS